MPTELDLLLPYKKNATMMKSSKHSDADEEEYTTVPRNEEDSSSSHDEATGIFRTRPTTTRRRRRNPCSLGILVCSLVSAGLLGLLIRVEKVLSSSSSPVAGCKSNTHNNPHEQHPPIITYDASALAHAQNNQDTETTSFVSPETPQGIALSASSNAYKIQPDIHNGTIVFIADGDLYYASTASSAAARLTVTVGNVRTPHINPVYPYYLAFTATYQARREVYVMDLRSAAAVQRLTYSDTAVQRVVGWGPDGKTLRYTATSDQVGLQDGRLYDLQLDMTAGVRVTTTVPVPLTQALDSATADNACTYFVRYTQSSWTARYVGGTAESLWAYCAGQQAAVSLTRHDYKGTSTSPKIVILPKDKRAYLLFVSDRTLDATTQTWQPGTRNVWAAPLPTKEQLYTPQNNDVLFAWPVHDVVPLTQASCHFNGLQVREFAVDRIDQTLVLRIGADLYHVPAKEWTSAIDKRTTPKKRPTLLPVQVLSDFQEQHERLVKIKKGESHHVVGVDVFTTADENAQALLTLRGQVWVAPVVDDTDADTTYQGQTIPLRRYRVIPGSMTGGAIRVLTARHVPLYKDNENRRFALVLATDPKSATAEHAFYLVEIQHSHTNMFADFANSVPIVGGHLNGGSTKDGGLGSVDGETVVVSPCGRRVAWTDTDDRICVMSIPLYNTTTTASFQCLPPVNAQNEPLSGTIASLVWSPGGRYLGIHHQALNHFKIISIADCGVTMDKSNNSVQDIQLDTTNIVQVTPSRFNSYGMWWGKTAFDVYLKKTLSSFVEAAATTLYFLSDRDVVSDVKSPWGSRAPMPHFVPYQGYVYALPLPLVANVSNPVPPNVLGRTFSGGGAQELFAGDIEEIKKDAAHLSRRQLEEVETFLRAGKRTTTHELDTLARHLAQANATPSPFPEDTELSFDDNFMRRTYRMVRIKRGRYVDIVGQSADDASLAIATLQEDGTSYDMKVFQPSAFPADTIEEHTLSGLSDLVSSTCRKYVVLTSSTGDRMVAETATASSLTGVCKSPADWKSNAVQVEKISLSIWPALEYRQMYSDAWRMLRDYFYDPGMHQVAWRDVHDRYLPLVSRCVKREDLDDVMGQMASELSALHVFVYGGEYSSPEAPPLAPASLGATLVRAPEWKGFKIVEIPERDPDYDTMDETAVYSPLSDQTLRPSGQRGLQVGDVIVSINGESVMLAPEINMMIRGMAGQSIRLGVLRQPDPVAKRAEEETVIAVPITVTAAKTLRYDAWEWRTEQKANDLATKAGIRVGYLHMKGMDRDGEDAFTRGYFPAFDRDGLIIDVRHNVGGNIDSWILSTLQRKAWMFWAGRLDQRYGDMDWTQQFAFRGKIVVLVDEHTSSNGEGVARGISELGLGVTIGTRTWGGGIWGSSANKLVDGGIAAAPQWGIFNKNFGWGGGIESTGLTPDIIVDNDPRLSFDGRDVQLERAIVELKKMLDADPIEAFAVPAKRPDMSLHNENCAV